MVAANIAHCLECFPRHVSSLIAERSNLARRFDGCGRLIDDLALVSPGVRCIRRRVLRRSIPSRSFGITLAIDLYGATLIRPKEELLSQQLPHVLHITLTDFRVKKGRNFDSRQIYQRIFVRELFS